MNANLSSLLYLVAAVCFIMALKGLSSPVSARNGNRIGIGGMALAVLVTLFQPGVESYWLVVLGVIIG
ncbi:MAG TPA: NAD synthetase, partial [Tistrella mobilis]|nr:NAD synthetase [Tistrella mobilis]